METDKTKRREIKYVIDIENYNKLYLWIKKNSKGFIEQFQPRIISNIYFDTLNFNLLNENLAGLPDRYKVRLRWYDSLNYINDANLEIKIKKNQLGWKKRKKFQIRKEINNFSKQDIKKLILFNVDNSEKNHLKNLEAVLINNYKREYYVSFDKKIRLTIDKNFKIFNQIGKKFLNNSDRSTYNQNIILEIKLDNEFLDDIHGLFNDIPFRASRSSKYVSSFYSLM